MLCVPAVRLDVEHVAVRVFPVPESERPEQIVVPPSTKLTVPVGAFPVTLAVSVMLAPSAAGFAELASEVVVAGAVTTCDRTVLVEAELLTSPE
jgi:hypothetical protein